MRLLYFCNNFFVCTGKLFYCLLGFLCGQQLRKIEFFVEKTRENQTFTEKTQDNQFLVRISQKTANHVG